MEKRPLYDAFNKYGIENFKVEELEYLEDDLPKLTLEQAKFKQHLGLNEWDELPEGVEYPE